MSKGDNNNYIIEIKDEDEANPNAPVDPQLFNRLRDIFPEACPKYIRALCRGKIMSGMVLNWLIGVILDSEGQYPKRERPPPEPETLPENQLELLKELLPDADPDYLSEMCDKFENKAEVEDFVYEAIETQEYPKMKEYLRRQQLSAQQKQYTTEFNVENFVKVIPDPVTFFEDPSRNKRLENISDIHYAMFFLRNKFNKLLFKKVKQTFEIYRNIPRCIAVLESAPDDWKSKTVRKIVKMGTSVENIPLLQEVAYFSHKEEIIAYLQKQKDLHQKEVDQAKKMGLMKTCSCCYDEEVLPKNIYRCEKGCEFCQECVTKSSEVHFAEGKLKFPCLMNCSAVFSLHTLQMVLSPKLFSIVAQKKSLEEVKSAGIDELEMCPFCDFATIIPEGNKIFTCLNSECMKESCRLCKEPNHIPLRCDEVEKDEDVKARVLVENRMTDALLKKCYKCGLKFFKEEGCNKMTCSCGAQMCYVCGKPVGGYGHFNGNGGTRFDLCPLYSDSHSLNMENVLKGAQTAKTELGITALKFDPATDMDQYFDERRKKYPQGTYLVGQIQQPAQHPLAENRQRQVQPEVLNQLRREQ